MARGLNYVDAVARLDARFVATLQFQEAAQRSREQRKRNMRLLGFN